MDELTRHEDRLPYCDCHACAIYERDRLRAELAADRTCKESLLVALESLRAELAKANALLLTYGWHRDECAFLEVCDDCDCGFEAILRKALTINKAARKGEGEVC